MYSYNYSRNISKKIIKNKTKNNYFVFILIFFFGLIFSIFFLKMVFNYPHLKISKSHKSLLKSSFVLENLEKNNQYCKENNFKIYFHIDDSLMSGNFLNKIFLNGNKITFSKKNDFLTKINNVEINKKIILKIKNHKNFSKLKNNHEIYSEGNILMSFDDKFQNASLFLVSKKFPNYVALNYLKIGELINKVEEFSSVNYSSDNKIHLNSVNCIYQGTFKIQNLLKYTLKSAQVSKKK